MASIEIIKSIDWTVGSDRRTLGGREELCSLPFPMLSDIKRELAAALGQETLQAA